MRYGALARVLRQRRVFGARSRRRGICSHFSWHTQHSFAARVLVSLAPGAPMAAPSGPRAPLLAALAATLSPDSAERGAAEAALAQYAEVRHALCFAYSAAPAS